MKFEKDSPISKELLSGDDNDLPIKIKNIYENEFCKSKVKKNIIMDYSEQRYTVIILFEK